MRRLFPGIVIITLLLFSGCQRGNDLIVVNASGQMADVTVTIGGEIHHYFDLTDGESRLESFTFQSDDSFAISGELADGTPIDAPSAGYVTSGMGGLRATITIQPDGRIDFVMK